MNKKAIKYNKAIEQLNDVLVSLESESVDVDQVSAMVKNAVELIKICRDKISKTELEVRKIVKEFEKDSKKGTE